MGLNVSAIKCWFDGFELLKEAAKYHQSNDRGMATLCTELADGVKGKCLEKLTWYHIAASVLYPPLLHHPALQTRDGDVADVRRDLQVIVANFGNTDDSGPPARKFRKLLPDSDSEQSDVEDSAGLDDNPHASEVDKYFELDALLHCSEDTTPLEFWKSQSSKFVKLSDIARSVYGIPATQNRSERSFSAAGHVVTDLRTNIDPDHVDELLLLRSYYRQTHDNGDTADNSDED